MMPSKIWVAVKVAVLVLACVLAAVACGSETGPTATESVGTVAQAVTVAPDPAGSPGASCGGFVERQANGDVRYAIKFPQPQAYVEVFVRQNGIQNIAQNIVASAVANGDGTYTYSLVKAASQYHSGDIIQARFYSYRPSRPGVFTPGPAETVWLPNFIYGQTTCSSQPPSGCHQYITTLANGDLRFAVTLPDVQQYVEVFVQQNGIQNIAQNIVGSRVPNGNGTSTFSLVKPASQYHAGDVILTRFYSYKASSPGVFTPGPLELIWAPEFIVGSSCGQPIGGSCTSDQSCQPGLSCIVGHCRDCAAGGCDGSSCTTTSSCVPGLACAAGVCHAVCDGSNTNPNCIPPHCADGVRDGAESRVDCGGDCPACAACTPQCDGHTCGQADGCGSACANQCSEGQACSSDFECSTNLVCFGGACRPPDCRADPRLLGCGYPGARCGGSCSTRTQCTQSSDCAAGYICPTKSNSINFGLRPGTRVCQKEICFTDPVSGGCGQTTSECGLSCAGTPNCSNKHCGDADLSDGSGGVCTGLCQTNQACALDVDCVAGDICRDSRCVPVDPCSSPNLAPPNCGGPASLCGSCPASLVEACDGRECGPDPSTGASCGSCGGGFFCNGAGHCALLDSTAPISVPSGNGGTRVVTPPADTPAPALFGAIPGTFSVTERGSSAYSIPIEVPPGRGSLEPRLAIRYTSTTGNGALGIGWSLDGLSTIARCQHTFASDGQASPPLGDGSDAFCLDGQRLTLVLPNEYRTAVESFSKIVAVGGDERGPDSFKVFTHDGKILFYGSAADARGMLSDQVVGTWALNRVEDRSGNSMRIAYRAVTHQDSKTHQKSTSELLPDVLTYTGFNDVDGDREVKFVYTSDRPDWLKGFGPAGSAFSRGLRLDRINVKAQQKLVRNYGLTYEIAPNGASRVASVQECAGINGQACKAPTVFQYIDESGFGQGRVVVIPNEEGSQLPPDIGPFGLTWRPVSQLSV